MAMSGIFQKFVADALDDPKLRRGVANGLRELELLPWLLLFARVHGTAGALEVDGEGADPALIAMSLPGVTPERVATAMASLRTLNILTKRPEDGVYVFTAWDKRNGKPPSAGKEQVRERVAKHRAKAKRGATRSVTSGVTTHETSGNESSNADETTIEEEEEKEKEEDKEAAGERAPRVTRPVTGSVTQGATAAAATAATTGNATIRGWTQLEADIPVDNRPDLEGALRASQDPDALRRTLVALTEAITGGPVFSPAIIGQALTELRASGRQVTPLALRTFCGRIAKERAAPIPKRSPEELYADA